MTECVLHERGIEVRLERVGDLFSGFRSEKARSKLCLMANSMIPARTHFIVAEWSP